MKIARWVWNAAVVVACGCGSSGVEAGDDHESGTTSEARGDVGDCDLPVCGIDLACGSVSACGTMVHCGRCEAQVIEGVRPQHIVADPLRRRVYATVRSGDSNHANELVVVDLAAGAVVDSVFLGSNPNRLAISDDASTLWVALDGTYEVVEVDLTSGSPVPGERYKLPLTTSGQRAFAGPMVVLPGTTDRLAVSLHRRHVSSSFSGLVVLDGGVARHIPTRFADFSRLTSGPPGWLFGYDDQTTGHGFFSLEIDAEEPVLDEFGGVSGFWTDIVYADGRVYATSGEMVDVSDPGAPQPAGMLPYPGRVLPQPELGRVLMLSANDPITGASATLRVFDTATFTELHSMEFPDLRHDMLDDFVTPDGVLLAVLTRDWSQELYVIPNPFFVD